jgi:hypothetical protein
MGDSCYITAAPVKLLGNNFVVSLFYRLFFNRDLIMYILHFSCNVRNASNDLTFDSVEPPVNISIPRI